MTNINKMADSPTSYDSKKKQSGGANISELIKLLNTESNTELELSTATEDLESQLKALLQSGGASKKKAKKSSKKKASKKKAKKSSKKKYKSDESTVSNQETSEKKEEKKRKPNPALKAFAELSKHVSTVLKIPNGPKAKKLAGLVKRDTAELHPNLDSVSVMKKAIEHFNSKVNHYKEKLE